MFDGHKLLEYSVLCFCPQNHKPSSVCRIMFPYMAVSPENQCREKNKVRIPKFKWEKKNNDIKEDFKNIFKNLVFNA